MAKVNYTASLSQSQGRTGYSVIFRHPVRVDEATGRPGLRVRRGLGTKDEGEANGLRAELNVLLADATFHDPAARKEAERRFDARVVEIFFDRMAPEEFDFTSIRDRVIPLPASEPDGYRRVLFLGTTGAGKTTLVRQLIGTDPDTERFPSTSTAKTTIHDTEILCDTGPWRAVVTFVSSDETREYLNECISAAVLAAAQRADDATILRRLLSHVNQKFRFNYILGNGPDIGSSDFDSEDDEIPESEEQEGIAQFGTIDLLATQVLLGNAVKQIRGMAGRLGEALRTAVGAGAEGDDRVVEELFEEELDNLLRDEEGFHVLADSLMDEIEKRFDLLPPGEVTRTRQGWPLTWRGEWAAEGRPDFLKAVSRFSSNYAPYFGVLLTPLVNGVRVAGKFHPAWDGGVGSKLILLDGEGMGHTPKSTYSVSTSVSRRIEMADAVVLVDNATQPMQAAPLAAMREIIATGNARKLILAFTHFDEVRGDNLPSASAKADHVLASAENVLASFGEELGSFAEQALRQRLERARFFLANLDANLSADTPAGTRTVKQLRGLLAAVDAVIERPVPTEATPVYDRLNLVLAVRSAAEAFQDGWKSRLGLEQAPGYAKEHWARVKALSRRLGASMGDEYDNLKPVADLRRELVERMYVFTQNPVRWDGPEPSDEEKRAKYDMLAEGISKRILELASRRVWRDKISVWQGAYDKRGQGSTFQRARIIGDEIYEAAAPVPDMTPSPDRNQFLREVLEEVEAAASAVGIELR